MTKTMIAAVLLSALLGPVGCESDANAHRVGDAYERNNMPSADPDRPAGPHSLSNDAQGDNQVLHQSR